MVRLALFAGLAAAFAWSQQAATPRVSIGGIVTEPGVNQPLADAEITVIEFVRQPYKTTEVAKGKTDLQGNFHFDLDKFATYIVQARKPGYSDGGGSLNGASEQVVLDKDHLSHEVRFSLVRTGELTGRVVDDETGMPVPNFRVAVKELNYLRGEAIWGGVPVEPTDAEGHFVAKGARPGNYLVQVIPQILYKEQLQVQFTPADLETVDRDYPNSYWPGGHGLDSASTVRVPSGGSVGAGTIHVKKENFYRIHISIPSGSCTAGEKIQVIIEMAQFQQHAGGEVSCGSDFLLRNFQPGSYLLYLDAAQVEHRSRVVLPFEVVDRNLDLKVSLMRGPDITGRIIPTDGAKAPAIGAIKISMRTDIGPVQFGDEGQPVTPDDAGNFRFTEVPLARQRITVSGLGTDNYVKEIRYNGIPLIDKFFVTDGGSPVQTLDIVIDDKPANITGAVTDHDKAVSEPYVVLVRWPSTPENVFLAAKHSTGDDKGQFRFTGLAPGEYRVLGVSQTTMQKLEEPNVLFRLLGSAEAVTLDQGASQNLSLKLTDPGR